MRRRQLSRIRGRRPGGGDRKPGGSDTHRPARRFATPRPVTGTAVTGAACLCYCCYSVTVVTVVTTVTAVTLLLCYSVTAVTAVTVVTTVTVVTPVTLLLCYCNVPPWRTSHGDPTDSPFTFSGSFGNRSGKTVVSLPDKAYSNASAAPRLPPYIPLRELPCQRERASRFPITKSPPTIKRLTVPSCQ